MVDALARTGRRDNDWGFVEEPPGRPSATVPRATRPAGPSHPLLLDVSVFTALSGPKPSAPTAFETITGANRSFTDAAQLGEEILRLKSVAPRHSDEVRAALRQQIVMRQAEWVAKAKTEGLAPPAGAIDPFRATPAEVANALLWMEAGGVIPRDELARDGGHAFTTSVRDAVVLRTRGFDAMLALHAGKPEEQRGLLVRELALRGVKAPPAATLDALQALYTQSARIEDAQRRTAGLDGRVGTGADVDAYEREQVVAAANPGSTLGSLMATWGAYFAGGIDIERMRAAGNAGNAAEGMAGGAGVHLNMVANEREPPGTVKRNTDDFNRSGLRQRFEVTPMKEVYAGENAPGDNHWNLGTATKPYEVRYAERPSDRAAYKLEARQVMIDGKREVRLFDAEGNLFDTREASTHDGSKRAIFVMNSQGEVYASTFQERAYLHHSSLSGGQPVAAAGELVVENGKIVRITNQSGHYKPEPKYTDQLITSFREQGLDLAGVKVTTYKDGDPSTRVLP